MDCIYFPVIAEDDFESFRSIMHGELPTTYKEWLEREADRIAHWQKTHKIVEVKVKANDFSTYLRASWHGTYLNSLYVFTESIGKRNKN